MYIKLHQLLQGRLLDPSGHPADHPSCSALQRFNHTIHEVSSPWGMPPLWVARGDKHQVDIKLVVGVVHRCMSR